MRSTLFSHAPARHARSAFHPSRSHLSAGLTAALLPLCLAAPALADTAPVPAAATTNFAAPDLGRTDSSAETATTDDAAPASAQPAAASPADTTPAGRGPWKQVTRAPEASPSARAAQVAAEPEPAAAQKQTTTMRISGPRGTVAPGRHQIAVRLLADDRPVQNGYVRIETWGSQGWAYAGRLLTRENGLGYADFSFSTSTKVRALYEGSQTRTAETSPELPVSVQAQQASFRKQALKVAAQQRGKPYRYGSTGPSSFDCSGFTGYVFSKVGKSLPRTSRAQRRATQPVPNSQARPGDLIFMTDNGRDIGHVGIYAGDGKMWDAPRSGGRVSLRRIWSSDYRVGRVA